ncbi:Glycosyl transferase family 2 [Pseudobutyrivibrio sp. ACV-2]|uniref:glycosyltransferase n=1 Tax=Pseudobutyrivibrio sp. ACV-2 TaxID=1520801 RepID=UPI00089A8FF6|nr:glycosyltransferase [Pseudobutyrivibrio sp. ACV-2]SEA10447.1 Glycosyl transferase family 2 [Pseudobutyrivibrio sp. ACV-2]
MNRKTTISIIITIHNSAKYIPRIKDCLNVQSFADFEAIFIVSGDDDSLTMLESYAELDQRIRIIADSNSSYGHKINVGIAAAVGEYIAILESDDEYDPGFLQELITAMEPEVDYVKGSFTMFLREGTQRILLPCSLVPAEDHERIIEINHEPQYRINAYTHIWTGLYRKQFLTDNHIICNESPGASYQDVGFSVLCALYAQKIKFSQKPIYLYRVDNVKSSTKDDSKYLCIKEEFDWLRNELKTRSLETPDAVEFYELVKKGSYLWNAKRLHSVPRQKFLQAVEEGIVDLNSLKLVEEAIDRLPSLLQILKNETNCILWGAAGIGQEVLLAQKILGVKAIKKVVDNNPAIVGQNLLGYIVQKPDMKNVNTDYRYIITGRKSTPELKRQLMSAGVNEEKIFEIREGLSIEVLVSYIQ